MRESSFSTALAAGKSSIAKALQAITVEPFLYVQTDVFLDMLPAAYQQHSDGFNYQTLCEEEKSLVVIGTRSVGEHLLRGMRRAIAAMAEQGNNLIVGDACWGQVKAEYTKRLSAFKLFRVEIFAPLDVLEARECDRGDHASAWPDGSIPTFTRT